MALTNKMVNQDKLNLSYVNVVDVTFDSSYPTGGESLTPAQLGMKTIHSVQAEAVGGYTFQYDRTNQKLKVYAGSTEVANATNLSAVKTTLTVFGRA